MTLSLGKRGAGHECAPLFIDTDVGMLGKRRCESPLEDQLLTNDVMSPSSPRAPLPPTPKTPDYVYAGPSFDVSEWVDAFKTRTWTSDKPAPTTDTPSKVLLPRGNNPLTVALRVLRLKTTLRTTPPVNSQKYNLDQTKYSGLLVLDCDRTILHSNAIAKRTTFRRGLSKIFQLCAEQRIQICFMSTAGDSTLTKYADGTEKEFGTKIDLRYSTKDHSAAVLGICKTPTEAFKVKILSHFFSDETLQRTVFVDDMLAQVCLQPENSFLVTEFYDDVLKLDRQLYHLSGVLKDVFSRTGDLRPVISERNGLKPLMDVLTQ